MRVTTKSTAPKPSLEMAKTILAQVHLLTEKLERGQFSNHNGQSGTDLATVQRRGGKFARRLGKLQTNVNKASRLLIPPDGKPEPAQ